MTAFSRWVHIFHAYAARSASWGQAHRIKGTRTGLTFLTEYGAVSRSMFTIDTTGTIRSGICGRVVPESTLIAWLNDPEGLRNLA